jgi:hypothetical protein
MEWIVRRRWFKEETTTHILPLRVWNSNFVFGFVTFIEKGIFWIKEILSFQNEHKCRHIFIYILQRMCRSLCIHV